MAYLGDVLFLISVCCQGLLFWRGWRWRGWQAYPFFYIYLSYTSFWTGPFLFFPHTHPLYPTVYWHSASVAAALRQLVPCVAFRGVFRQATVSRIGGTAQLALVH